uniref:Uncharacterized protein n=1 Tax=viral metagenome TaxID=1070528 RepID=A0A6M3KZ54_9ZZZZ
MTPLVTPRKPLEYLVCNRRKGKPRKPVAVCRKCDRRGKCKDFQRWEQRDLLD